MDFLEWCFRRLLFLERKFNRTQWSEYKFFTRKYEKEHNTMPEIRFTQEDLLERTQLQPGWYTLLCKSIEEGPGAKDPTSTTYTCIFVVDGGPANGVPIRFWFSDKAMGRIVDYIKCFLPNGKVEAGKVYDLNQTIGLKVGGYCQYDLTQGYNVIKDWKPSRLTEASAAAKK